MLKAHQDVVESGTSNVNSLLAKGAGVSALFAASRGLGQHLARSSFVSAFYDLALFEDQLMVDWLLQEDGDDVRYRLANVLLQPEVRKRFDLVVIDVPPRLTTGTINALCASSHVLIPTIFNPIAAEPVPNFLGNAIGLMSRLNRSVNFVGVVETMASPPNQGQEARRAGRLLIEEALQGLHPKIEILSSCVPRRVPIAEGGIAYLEDKDARAIFNELGDEISQRIGL
jgi:chromosome partitioning protein